MIQLLGLTEQDCNLGMLPLFHVGGLSATLAVMQAGGCNIILPKFEPDSALDRIERDRVTIFGEFPPMLDKILEGAAEKGRDLSSLKAVIGIERPETIRRLENETAARFWSSYGQTETSGLVSMSPYSDRPGSAGRPCLLAEVEIMDESGGLLGPGTPGEIVVRGPMVFKGYWKKDEDTAYTFRVGWHHTGDMGHLDEDGYLWYSGRLPEKELIKPGGENVYPAEVEECILQHPSIREAAVIGVPDVRWGEAIKAVCVLHTGRSLGPADLIEFVGSRIARFKKPQHVVFVPDLPRKEDGSIDRTKVKACYGDADSSR
jgi:acyl-CoA synthetase (AMP-forming)/AMP-acid ligase II